MMYTIWLTTACNLKCKYCYEGVNKKSLFIDENMSKEIVEYISKTLSDNEDTLYIDFHGGEVFLNYNILKLLITMLEERFPEKKKNYSLTTNATLLNDEMIDYIVKNIKNISVSIDGCKEKHNEFRPFQNGQGSYDMAMKNSLKLLDRLQERLRVRMTVTPSMVKNLSEDIKDLYQRGFECIVALPDIFNKEWTDEDYVQLKKEINLMKQEIIEDDIGIINLTKPLFLKKKSPCLGGVKEIDIYPDGSLYPCTLAAGIEEFKIGDVFTGVDNNKLQHILGYSNEIMHECCDCDMSSFCECTRCRIVNRVSMGSYLEPNNVQCVYNNTILSTNGYLLV